MRAKLFLSLLASLVLFSSVSFAEEPKDRKNINEATQSDLLGVKGIGKKTAHRILAYRGEKGAFKNMAQLLAVPRVGKKTLERLVCSFYVPEEGPLPCAEAAPADGVAKININTADAKRLSQLPGIGKRKAVRIIQHREKNGWFSSAMGLTEIKGIGKKTVARLEPMVETKLDINSARAFQFEAMGFDNGDTIVTYRAKNGPFKRVEDLKKVPVESKTLQKARNWLFVK